MYVMDISLEEQKLQDLGETTQEDLDYSATAVGSCGAVSLLPLLVLACRCGGEGGEAAGLPPLHAVLEAAHWGLLGLPGGQGYAMRHSCITCSHAVLACYTNNSNVTLN